ncbi:MAG: HAMP domain-containing sensor histidine kinase [Bacillota bacterium]|nr:HAMP domain-containing sensor histidine kinase [Bacillota bacterium]
MLKSKNPKIKFIKSEYFKKIIWILTIMVFLRIVLVIGLNTINIQSSSYIQADNGEIFVEENLDDDLHTVVGIVKNSEDKNLYVNSNSDKELSIFIANLNFLHEIYINDNLVSQNINSESPHYDENYAYKVLKINIDDYIDNKSKISVSGANSANSSFYIANNNIVNNIVEIITIVHILLLTFLLIGTIVSLVYYIKNKKEYYFLMVFFIGITSMIKAVSLGNISTVVDFVGITARNFTLIDNGTSLFNTILPLFIMYYLFDFKIKSKYVVISLLIFFSLLSYTIFNGKDLNYFAFTIFIIFLLNQLIMIYGYIKDKSYSKQIMIINVIYSSTAVYYYFMVLRGIYPHGSFVFYINPAYLGVVLYMSGFLLVILRRHLDEIKQLEKNKKDLERILLLRGISHDLKLPISVIMINNQMIEKYNLTQEDAKECAETSLEAARELEKMTENINCYLNLKQIDDEGYTTSVKRSFEKIKNFFDFYNSYKNYKFTVETDEKDCEIDINPTYFNRMLYNLLDNSFKYNSGNINVNISYRIEDKLTIVVEDNGIGMDKDNLKKVFEPFYREDPNRTKEGLGLGLSVVREVLDSINGEIKIESKKKIGTKITIELSCVF